VAGDFLDGAQGDAGAGQFGQAGAAHGVGGGAVEADCFEGFGEDVVGADALYVLIGVVCGGEEPGRWCAAVVQVVEGFLVCMELFAEFVVDGDIGVDGVFLFEAGDLSLFCLLSSLPAVMQNAYKASVQKASKFFLIGAGSESVGNWA
jgi:hypothetical protein